MEIVLNVFLICYFLLYTESAMSSEFAPGGCTYRSNYDYLNREYFNLKDVQAIDEENTHYLANMVLYAIGEEVFVTFSPTPKLWQGAPVYEIGLGLGENRNLNFYSFFDSNDGKIEHSKSKGTILTPGQPNKIHVTITTMGDVHVFINDFYEYSTTIFDGIDRDIKYVSMTGWKHRVDFYFNCTKPEW
ncbi:uncharacterized protein LOC116351703 [Contarinia nasturtii]|uniref:uncharacterized protein LOC116351703 n=1 Tax=Contarinia nasturtii TaxID=265458 RepID=UPI0012D3B70D|nr:uncharacterized protein LOC116351703 [Contarinia nasturtii]